MALRDCAFHPCDGETCGADRFCKDHAAFEPLSNAIFDAPLVDGEYYKTEPLTGVYVIGSFEVGAIKVGIARDVIDRMAGLQTGFPRKLCLFSAVYTDRKSAARLERECHAKLTEFGFHLNGEWFDADPDDVIALVKKCADAIGVAVLSPSEYWSILSGYYAPMHNVEMAPVVRRISADAIYAIGG